MKRNDVLVAKHREAAAATRGGFARDVAQAMPLGDFEGVLAIHVPRRHERHNRHLEVAL